MREQAEKLITVEENISKEKGDFELFALFLRKDAPNKWDLLISADWARENKKESIEYILGKVREVLSDPEMLMLSRLIILNKDDEALKALHSAMHVEHGLAEVADSRFFGMQIKHAYLITSKKVEP